jgi:trehalose 6-phosphate phosphatase
VALDALRREPARTALLTDFDGTLSPIVEDPAAALPLPGAVEVLARLAQRYGLVGVVSGRPVSYLADRLAGVGDRVWLSGLYGLEATDAGRPVEVPGVAWWRPVVAEVVAAARERFGPLVEDKGLSLTLHVRTAPELEDEVRAWASAEAARSGLLPRPAKASVELHPPVPTDKGTVVEAAAGGMRAAAYFGDDMGDLAAFDGLDRLAAAGVDTVRVGVRTVEAPPELLRRADVVVEGPEGALVVLEDLAAG